MVNGLMFARITSTEYPLNVGGIVQYKNYKIKFKDCKECTILFGGSINTSDVFCGRWLKTSTTPTVMMIGPDGAYSIERTLDFDSSITNTVYYYPLTEALQPLSIESKGDGVYETLAVNDDGLIGYPLYWFTCDQTDVGPTMTFSHNINSAGNQLMFISNSGNSSKYNAKLYAGIDGNCNATPDGTATSNYTLQCTCKSGYTFSGVSSDADIPIDPTSISMVNKDGTSTAIGVTCTDNDIITLSLDKVQWVRKDTTATISLSVFDTNCLQVAQSPLTEAFNVHFDENVSFATSTNDVGYAGVRMGSSNMTSDIYDRYPYDLNKWDGLPKWLTNIDEGAVPQHMAIYAIHNTPTYTPDIPNSRQVAAILLDPGKMKTKDSTDETSNDERGRGYMISNDSIEYENNATSKYPKPARTVARICDVPTSVMQISGISGLSPTQVVDKQYVRSLEFGIITGMMGMSAAYLMSLGFVPLGLMMLSKANRNNGEEVFTMSLTANRARLSLELKEKIKVVFPKEREINSETKVNVVEEAINEIGNEIQGKKWFCLLNRTWLNKNNLINGNFIPSDIKIVLAEFLLSHEEVINKVKGKL
jgi:hypothetical protein